MGKISMRVYHKDQAAEDHKHRLPDGSYTGGSLYKPNSDRTFPHTHLYEHHGKTLESCLAPVGGDHTHGSECGETSGPVPMYQGEARADSVERQGMYWVVKSGTGHVMSRHANRMDAEAMMKEPGHDEEEAGDAEPHMGAEEESAKSAMGDVDEGKWSEAKKASVKQYGSVKWPVVQTIYKNMGGA